MPRGKHKSRSLRRVHVKTYKNGTKISYRIRKPSPAKCANCKIILKGMSRKTQAKFRNLSKSEKKPSRMYGGLLCSKCARRKIIESVRQ